MTATFFRALILCSQLQLVVSSTYAATAQNDDETKPALPHERSEPKAETVDETPSEISEAIETYQPPVRAKVGVLRYPHVDQVRAREGWVSLNFMVSPQGKPYEITVTDSIGGERFEEEAIKALEKTTYQPARLNGQPIDAGVRMAYAFSIQGGAPGARFSFVRQWRQVEKNISADQREEALLLMEKLAPTSLYEDAYYQVSRALFALKWGTPEEVKAAAKRAIKRAEISDGAAYLPPKLLRTVMQLLMAAEFETNDFFGAWSTATELLLKEKDPAKRQKLEKAIDAIQEIKAEPGSFDVSGEIAEDYSWSITPLKNRFRIKTDSGRLAELKLYCPTRYVGMVFDESMEYTVATKHGNCLLELIGDPGSRFTLTQR